MEVAIVWKGLSGLVKFISVVSLVFVLGYLAGKKSRKMIKLFALRFLKPLFKTIDKRLTFVR